MIVLLFITCFIYGYKLIVSFNLIVNVVKTSKLKILCLPLLCTNVKLAAGSGCGFDCEVSSGKRMRIQAADSIVKLAAGSGCGFQQRIRL